MSIASDLAANRRARSFAKAQTLRYSIRNLNKNGAVSKERVEEHRYFGSFAAAQNAKAHWETLNPGRKLVVWDNERYQVAFSPTEIVCVAEWADADPMHAALLAIAKRALNLDTLDERGSDWADFSTQHVLAIKTALQGAYEAGVAAAKNGQVSK